ncbi:MAG: hypothetical protein JWN35_1074 [Frankiales bacterium]|nr:hypothetical protein [Frankiales bacterium]
MRPSTLTGTIALGAGLTLVPAPLIAAVPASAAVSDPNPACPQNWEGAFDTWSGNTHYGVVTLNQESGGTGVTGTYPFSGGGVITGTAQGLSCSNLVARYRDKKAHGDIYVHFAGSLDHFEGYYRACGMTCFGAAHVPWRGTRL